MKNQGSFHSPMRKHRWGWLVLLIFAVGVISFVAVQRNRNEMGWEELRKDGYPFSLADLNAWYKAVPDTQNAALKILEAARNMVVAPNQALDPLLQPNFSVKDLTAQNRQNLDQLIANNLGTFATLHEAAGMHESRFPIDLTQGANTLLPYLAPMKNLAKLERYRSLLMLATNDAEGAVNCFKDNLGAAHSLLAEPVLISQLVRFAMVTIALDDLQRLLDFRGISPSTLAELQVLVSSTDSEGQLALQRGFLGERCMGVDFFRKPAATVAQMSGSMGSGGAYLLKTRAVFGLSAYDFRLYRRAMSERIKVLNLPYPARLAEAIRLDREFAASSQGRVQSFLYLLTRTVIPNLDKAVHKDAIICARLRAAQTALAIERFRAKQSGRLPENLEKLVPEFIEKTPMDPFDGKPLRYRQLENGYCVYSVGENLRDDSGQAKLDVTFTVQR